jgi:glycosyltransferase involved in cell wall biosynthesis
MRNVKDERLFDPAAYDRDAVRAEFGFAAEDRAILFGGLVRRHKGVFELAELVERLGAPYHLLVVGNRETADLLELRKRASGRITILPPQPPERMAALNLAADLVVLWLDPAVPASHYQCPYKLTDALAMGPAVIASPVGELAVLAARDVLWTVPFGDFDGLARTIRAIFSDATQRARRRERARKLFLREFSYNSVRAPIALAAARLERRDQVYPVAAEFADAFAEFEKRLK